MNKREKTVYVLIVIMLLLGFVVGFMAGYQFVGKDIERHYTKELTIAYNQLETCKTGFSSKPFVLDDFEVQSDIR